MNFWAQQGNKEKGSELEKLLASGEATLEKVFEEESLGDNLNMGTETLVQFLCSPHCLDKMLVYLSTELDPTEHDYKHCLKYPYLAAQIFNDYRVEKVMEAFLDLGQPQEGARLVKMYDAFRTTVVSPTINPTLTGYFDGVFRTLLAQHPTTVLKVALRPDLLDLLFEHFEDFSVLGVLLKTTCLEVQVVADAQSDLSLAQRLAVLDRVVQILLKTPIDLHQSVYSDPGSLALNPDLERVLNSAAYLRTLVKDMSSIDPQVVARLRDAAFLDTVLQPFFEGDPFKASESLSVLVTLLDEVSQRRKKQSALTDESEPGTVSEDFVESPPFLSLYGKVVNRCGELLEQSLGANLLYQVLSVLSLIVGFPQIEIGHALLTSNVLAKTVEAVGKSGNENISHSKAVELFEKVFGAKPVEPLAVQAFGTVVHALENRLPPSLSRPDLNTRHGLSVMHLLARTLLVATRSSPNVEAEAKKHPAWKDLEEKAIERAKAYLVCLAGYKASDFRTDSRPTMAWGGYTNEVKLDWGSDSKSKEHDPFANVFESFLDGQSQPSSSDAKDDPFKAFGF